MTDDWKLWEPKESRRRSPSRFKYRRKANGELWLPDLAVELRRLVDEAMIYSGDTRRNRKTLDRLRLLLRRYPDALKSSHVRHNIGLRRLEWIAGVIGE